MLMHRFVQPHVDIHCTTPVRARPIQSPHPSVDHPSLQSNSGKELKQDAVRLRRRSPGPASLRLATSMETYALVKINHPYTAHILLELCFTLCAMVAAQFMMTT